MKILFAGGGSLGHVAPSVAVYRAVNALEPLTRVHFVCSRRKEEEAFLTKEKIPFTPIVRPRLSLALPIQYVRARRAARQILESFQPDVLFAKGGGLTVPLAELAHARGISVVLHETDAVSGRANRLLSRWADAICTGFPLRAEGGTRRRAPDDRLIYTGNPVRPEIDRGSAEKGLRIANLTGSRPILLVMGGSQGAQAINQIVWKHLDELLELTDMIHLTGRGKEGPKQERAGYYQRAFAHDDLPHFYAITDLALTRAGAGSISELATCGIPSILVPLRGVAQDHQMKNALAAVRTGGCLIVEQKDLDRKIVTVMRDLINSGREREQMAHNINRLAVHDAAEHIARIVLDFGDRAIQFRPLPHAR